MADPITHLDDLASALEAREDATRSAASDAESEALAEKLGALADQLARDRQHLTPVVAHLRRFRDDPSREWRLTGHGDKNDPESDLGL